MRTLITSLTMIVAATTCVASHAYHHRDSIDVALDSISRNLKEVTVTASTVERKGDRELITITREMRKGAINVAQMLESIDGMYLNRADNSLKYQGSDKIVILVDSVEKDVDYLKNLNHMRFDKIDVIHFPTGRYSEYDLLINLRRKENYEGYELSGRLNSEIFAGRRNGADHNLGFAGENASFTYTRNRWNFFVTHHYNWRDNASTSHETRIYPLNNLVETTTQLNNGEPTYRSYVRNTGPYVGTDFDINRNHSLSLTYYRGNTSIDNYTRTALITGGINEEPSDTATSSVTFRDKGYRHTWGLYYRGRTGLWSYYATFNYTINRWRTWNRNERSTGFMLEDNRRNLQDYTWTSAEVNRRTHDNKWDFSFGYMNYWKQYTISRLATGVRLSNTINRRNDMHLSAAYRPTQNLSMGLNGSIQFIDNNSDGTRENYLLHRVGGWLFHRFSSKVWTRINYNSSFNQPSISQISDYGEFTDSLQWSGGNPALRAFTSHNINATVGLFNAVNLIGGAFISPKGFSQIVEMREGGRPDGTTGPYAASQWQNANLRQWFAGVSAWKRVGRFSFNMFLQWNDIKASYKSFSHHKSGPTGNLSAAFVDNVRSQYVQLSYVLANDYTAMPQSDGYTHTDLFMIFAQKSLFHQRLTLQVQYTLPLHIASGRSVRFTESPVIVSSMSANNQFRIDNRLVITAVLQLSGGHSVRQYNREMQTD